MSKKEFWDIAHRGGEAYAPENTMAAFKLTLEYAIGWIETDVRRTKDNQLVLLHDELVDRTTDGSGSVHDFSLDELRNLDAGSWFGPEFAGERIPTLEELFGLCGDRVHYLLEIKDPGLIEEKLAESIEESGLLDNIFVIGMNPGALEMVRDICSEIWVGFTCPQATPADIDRALSMGAHHIIVRNQRLTPEFTNSCRERGLQVLSTTVRTEEELERAVRCNVLGMPLPDPRRLHDYLKDGFTSPDD